MAGKGRHGGQDSGSRSYGTGTRVTLSPAPKLTFRSARAGFQSMFSLSD